MSVLATVFIAIAAFLIGCIVGLIICMIGIDPVEPYSTKPNPVKTFNASELKPKEEVREPFVVSKIVLPKRIKELEYNKRVNAALKEVVDKAVNVWVAGDNKAYKRSLANHLYDEWHARIVNVSYRDYNPNLQRLNFIGRRVGSGFKFEAFWKSKDPKWDCLEYARRHKK